MNPSRINETNKEACEAMVYVAKAIQDFATKHKETKEIRDISVIMIQYWRNESRQLKQADMKEKEKLKRLSDAIKNMSKIVRIKVEQLEAIKAHSIAFHKGIKGSWEPKKLQDFVINDATAFKAMNTNFDLREEKVDDELLQGAMEAAFKVKMNVNPAEAVGLSNLVMDLGKLGLI